MPGSSRLECLLPECRAYARSICFKREDADDLVQDAMLRALKASCQPGSIRELRPWLFRVIRNLYNDELRKRRVRRAYFQHEQLSCDNIANSHDLERDVITRQVFNQLPPDLREVLFLIDVVELKYIEAAKIMNVPHGTVMSRISRARRIMFERLGGDSSRRSKKGGRDDPT